MDPASMNPVSMPLSQPGSPGSSPSCDQLACAKGHKLASSAGDAETEDLLIGGQNPPKGALVPRELPDRAAG